MHYSVTIKDGPREDVERIEIRAEIYEEERVLNALHKFIQYGGELAIDVPDVNIRVTYLGNPAATDSDRSENV